MSSAGLNDLIHWPLDTAENMRLKEDIIIQTLVGSCPNSYLIQFSVEAGHFLFSDHNICWTAEFQRNWLLFWNGDQFLRIILSRGKKKKGGGGRREGKGKQFEININAWIISVWIKCFVATEVKYFLWEKNGKDHLKQYWRPWFIWGDKELLQSLLCSRNWDIPELQSHRKYTLQIKVFQCTMWFLK